MKCTNTKSCNINQSRKTHFHIGTTHFHIGTTHFHIGTTHFHIGTTHFHIGTTHTGTDLSPSQSQRLLKNMKFEGIEIALEGI
jgi:hypothetical protein